MKRTTQTRKNRICTNADEFYVNGVQLSPLNS